MRAKTLGAATLSTGFNRASPRWETGGAPMDDGRAWVVWNGSIGMVDTAALGRVAQAGAGRVAWLAEPYEVVGPFSLDALEREGRVVFGACEVMSAAIWRETQEALRRQGQQRRRDQARRMARFALGDDGGAERESLGLAREGALTARDINSAFRRRAKSAHPDAGGDHDAYIRLTEARDALLARAAS